MTIIKTNTGLIGTNTYVVIEGSEAFVVDPGGHAERILGIIKDSGATLKAVLLTHEHFDHCMAVAALQRSGGVVYAHSQLAKNMEAGTHNPGIYSRVKVEEFRVDKELEDGEIFELCGQSIKVLHTKGHTSASVCYVMGNTIFTGDTLFCGSIGRTDLPTGNYDELIDSIKTKLLTLVGEYRVLPGHERETTLAGERENNTFLK